MKYICYSLSTSVMIIAVISTLHFMMDSAAIYSVLNQRGIVPSASARATSFIYLDAQLLGIAVSIALFAGAYMRLIWLCIPWFIETVLNILYHFYVLIILIMKTTSDFDAKKLAMVILITSFTMLLVYMTYVVFSFMQQVRGSTLKIDVLIDAQDEEDPCLPVVPLYSYK